MNTYIISSKNPEKGIAEAEKIISKENVYIFDRSVDEFEKDLGIEDVRNIKNKIFLKPLKGKVKSNILILKKSATISAQNAMLKLLEEPPPSSIIIIITENYHIFLPTILSRVKVILVKDDREIVSDGLKSMFEIEEAGDALYLAQEISKNKDEAIAWLENAILSARKKMLENLDNQNESLKYKNTVKKLEQTYYDLKNTNVNTRLTLENLFLNI